MIIGIGVDAIEVARMKRTLNRSGKAFLERVFTPVERRYCQGRAKPWESYAARFAAKEAVLKALGLGIAHDRLTHIEILGGGTTAPILKTSGQVRQVALKRGIRRWHLSLTHTATEALAFVVAER